MCRVIFYTCVINDKSSSSSCGHHYYHHFSNYFLLADVISVTYLLNVVTYWYLNIGPNIRRMNWSYFRVILVWAVIVSLHPLHTKEVHIYLIGENISKMLTAVSFHLHLFIRRVCRKGAVPLFRSTQREWLRSVWPSGQPHAWMLLFLLHSIFSFSTSSPWQISEGPPFLMFTH